MEAVTPQEFKTLTIGQIVRNTYTKMLYRVARKSRDGYTMQLRTDPTYVVISALAQVWERVEEIKGQV